MLELDFGNTPEQGSQITYGTADNVSVSTKHICCSCSIRTFCFSVLNIAIIYKTFVMPEIPSCSVHHSIYDHFCSHSTMSPSKL